LKRIDPLKLIKLPTVFGLQTGTTLFAHLTLPLLAGVGGKMVRVIICPDLHTIGLRGGTLHDPCPFPQDAFYKPLQKPPDLECAQRTKNLENQRNRLANRLAGYELKKKEI
jgi:hypothetical protein